MQPTIDSFMPTGRQQWREWLSCNHDREQAVWLIYPKKGAAVTGVTYAEAVEEALCFGWIDSKSQPINDYTYRQFFSRRKPGSGWSKVNKERIQRLTDAGLMMSAGRVSVDRAKQDGSWLLLDDIEALRIPADLNEALQSRPEAHAYFYNLCRSDKRAILGWIASAKRDVTRQRRIAELIEGAAQGQKPPLLRRTKK